MVYAAIVAVAALTAAWQSAQNGVIEARRQRKQNKAKYEQLQDQFDLSRQNVENNEMAIREQKLRNDLAIEEAALEAESRFAQVTGGSGISGRTVDIIEADIESEINKAKNDSERQATRQIDRDFLGLMRFSNRREAMIEQTVMFDTSANEANIAMSGISAGVQTGAQLAGSFYSPSPASAPTPKGVKKAPSIPTGYSDMQGRYSNIA
jgi:TolA-binding protein